MKKGPTHSKVRGFTLLEMTLALAMTMGIASMIVGMLQQQISFTKVLLQFSFLREEAPNINTLMTTILHKADSYRIYGDIATAKAANGAIQTNGRAVRLRLRNPDGTASNAIISFELQGGVKRLNYYSLPQGQTAWPTTPSWTISSRPALVNFENSTGILLITMTGPDGEEITYAGNPE